VDDVFNKQTLALKKGKYAADENLIVLTRTASDKVKRERRKK